MTTPELPNTLDFIPRRRTAEKMAATEELFVGATLLNAAEYLANTQGFELEHLMELGRPLSVDIARPTTTGHREYEFFVCVEEESEYETTDAPLFEYVLSCADTEIMPLSTLSTVERHNIRQALEKSEEPDDDLLFLLDLDAPTQAQENLTFTREHRTYYRCFQQALAIEKNVEAHYSIDGVKIASISYDSDEEITDSSNPQNLLLMDRLMDLSIIEPEDIQTMEEILYYLSLPGGTIATDVTVEYIDDARVIHTNQPLV